MMFAVAGAMTMRSALSVREMCGMSPVNPPPSMGNIFWMGVTPVSTSKGSGCTNEAALSVRIVCTSAPSRTSRRARSIDLYEAMPPDTPRAVFLPERGAGAFSLTGNRPPRDAKGLFF